MAGERDVLAEALHAAAGYEHKFGPNGLRCVFGANHQPEADRVRVVLAARGWRLVPSADPTTYWTRRLRAMTHPEPAAPSPEPLPLDVADHYRELARALNAESIPRGTSVQAYRKQVVARLYEILDAAALREPDRPT